MQLHDDVDPCSSLRLLSRMSLPASARSRPHHTLALHYQRQLLFRYSTIEMLLILPTNNHFEERSLLLFLDAADPRKIWDL